MDTLYTFGDNLTHYKTESVHFFGLMNSATKLTSRLRNVTKEPQIRQALHHNSYEPFLNPKISQSRNS